MTGLFDVLAKVLDIFAQLIPRIEVIASTHRGICWLLGRWPVQMNPGVYIIWPVLMQYVSIPVYWRTQDCWEKPATTQDDKSVTYDCGVVYRVSNAKIHAAACCPNSAGDIVQMYALELIHDEITKLPFSSADQSLLGRTIQKRVLRKLNDSLKEYGMEARDVKIPAFARTRVLHLIGNIA